MITVFLSVINNPLEHNSYHVVGEDLKAQLLPESSIFQVFLSIPHFTWKSIKGIRFLPNKKTSTCLMTNGIIIFVNQRVS